MNKNYFSFLILKQSVITKQASGYQNIVFSSVHILLSTVTNVILLYYSTCSKHIQHPSARTWRIWGGGGVCNTPKPTHVCYMQGNYKTHMQ